MPYLQALSLSEYNCFDIAGEKAYSLMYVYQLKLQCYEIQQERTKSTKCILVKFGVNIDDHLNFSQQVNYMSY